MHFSGIQHTQKTRRLPTCCYIRLGYNAIHHKLVEQFISSICHKEQDDVASPEIRLERSGP